MSQAQVSQASSDFVCTWTTGGLDAGWVHLAGALDIETAPQLARALRATVADASGRARHGRARVCDLAWVTERAENLVSHHVRALRSHGLAESRRDGKMVLYRLTDRGRALLQALLVAEEVARR